ncbi:MAG: MarR family transcriptional regulator [bacterium]|nr:MarR family transcriptional regulator [bacterium]
MTRERLMRELIQTRPFDPPEAEAFFNLLKTEEMLSTRLAETLKPFGLTPSQYNALRIVNGSGVEGIPSLEIGERLITRVPDVTRMIDRLVEKGLVERRRSDRDRRVVRVFITPAGKQLVESAVKPLRKFQKQWIGVLSDDDQAELNRLLYKLRYRD